MDELEWLVRKLRRYIRVVRKPLLIFSILAFIFWLFSINQQISEAYVRLRYNSNSLRSAGEEVKYLVDTPGCKIVEMEPFSAAVTPFLRNGVPLRCETPVVHLLGEELRYTDDDPYQKNANCCFSEIHRKNYHIPSVAFDEFPDQSITFSRPCQKIPPGGVLMPSEFVRVTCESNTTERPQPEKYYYAKPLPLERHSGHTATKQHFWKENEETKENSVPPSVLIIMIKSTSRNNFIRNMPVTRDYLLQNDFVELDGFAKTNGRISRSLAAMLAGVSLHMMKRVSGQWSDCFRPQSRDRCPYVWKNFSDNLYVTGFMEDAPGRFAFGGGSGFLQQPTDYYGRPLGVAYMQHGVGHGHPSCVGGLSEIEIVMDYTLDFIQEAQHVPYFFLSVFKSVSGTDLNGLMPWDLKFRSFFRKVQKLTAGKPQAPVVIMLSDQGTHYGFFPTTVQGEYENSLPFAFIRVPPALKEQYPLWYTNLKQNAHRLTSHLDIHATLEDILHLSYLDDPNATFTFRHSNWENVPNRSVYSLFEEIPITRTCESALIPEENCPCGLDIHDASLKEKHDIAKNLTDKMLSVMNGYLEKEIKSNVCVPLELEELSYFRTVRRSPFQEEIPGEAHVRFNDYVIGVVVKYSGATYEAFARVMDDDLTVMEKGLRLMIPTVGQSSCLKGHEYQQLCMCRDYVERILKEF